jgi:hypothetical protein
VFLTHYFSENLVVPGIEPRISVSVARSSDNETIEAVHVQPITGYIFPEIKRSELEFRCSERLEVYPYESAVFRNGANPALYYGIYGGEVGVLVIDFQFDAGVTSYVANSPTE